jgi:type I restriction enzyme M protein
MFVQSKKFVEGASGKSTDISIWGQESNPKTWRLAKMNLLSRRLEGNLGDRWGDTLLNDLHPNLKADYVITNPPFNIKDWGWEDRQKDDRWKYGVPPKGNANYAWIQHYLYHLAKRGMAAIVMSNGSLSTIRKEEKVVREGIIADDKLDCVIMLPAKLFDNVAISACIWILANDKKDPKFRERSGETLFIDCRRMGYMVNRTKRELAGEDVEKVSQAYQNWRSKDSFGDYEDERGFCKAVTTKGEIAEHGGIIVPGRYVGVPPLPDDGEPFEEKMKRLTSELGEHFAESRRIEDEIRKNLGDLGFDV